VDTIDVDILAAIWDLVPVMKLVARRAKCVLVAKDSLDWNLIAHVLHVVVIPVLDKRPQARILLELIIEEILSQVLYVLDGDLTGAPNVIWDASNVGRLQAEAFCAFWALDVTDQLDLLRPILAKEGVDLEKVRSNTYGNIVVTGQIWIVIVRLRNQTWFDPDHL